MKQPLVFTDLLFITHIL
jgi:transposase